MKRHLLILLLVGWMLPAWSLETPRVVQFTAAYLFKIARFVEWHENPREVQLCLAPGSQLAEHVGLLQGRSLGADRQLSVAVSGVEEKCHIYFGQLKDEDQVSPRTLTISDAQNNMQRGSALQLFLQDGHLRFSVDQDQLCDPEHPSGYQISAKLLQLARRPS